MHWLADRIDTLTDLANRHQTIRGRRLSGAPVSEGTEKQARRELMDLVDLVVSELAEREGVLASFAAHDGLLVTGVGDRDTLEAMAAMSQWTLMPSETASDTLGLGHVDQLLISGADRKLVVLRVGEVTLGVLSPRDAVLAANLAQ